MFAGQFFYGFNFFRFAILSGPTIPIIGEGDEEANDRYFACCKNMRFYFKCFNYML